MTGTWTDDDLDSALGELGAVLDRDADVTALAVVRGRLADTQPADVLEVGDPPGRPVRRSRIAPALLVAAALVIAVVLAAVFWPRATDRVQPTAPTPVATSSAERVQRELDLLPRPLPTASDSLVLFETSGVGDADFGGAFHVEVPVGGGPTTTALTYSFVCGDPSSDPEAAGRMFRVTDNLGSWGGTASCVPLGTGAASVASVSPPTVAGRTGIRVQTPNPGVVWRLVVSVGPR